MKKIVLVVLLVVASVVFVGLTYAGDIEDENVTTFSSERLALGITRNLEMADEVIDTVKTISTREIFKELDKKHLEAFAIKQVDRSKDFDWELAVSNDLKAVAIAANWRW